eukprot:CAMPEP_0116927044 /NCGR_PEP_ID=MMETSP0467-20121206/25099_1 /TAXON_ID=283647 /ORGANISM="Mesodinium pulex, Strain SPMC105" /LENGTH=116 /DNA_ID=CAMNT_0004606443 /DNA_START=172 /DNA_END=522 /DNA_ORIENTATION=-
MDNLKSVYNEVMPLLHHVEDDMFERNQIREDPKVSEFRPYNRVDVFFDPDENKFTSKGYISAKNDVWECIDDENIAELNQVLNIKDENYEDLFEECYNQDWKGKDFTQLRNDPKFD